MGGSEGLNKAMLKVSGFLWPVWYEHDRFYAYAQVASIKWAAQTQDTEEGQENWELILGW